MIPARKIAPPRWMRDRAARAVIAAIAQDGAPARFVGGCVRDAVAGRAVKDVDIATPLAPQRVTELLGAAGLRAIPTGIDHGTVTALVDGKPLEVTTLRRDVETFGRRARVEFTDDWEADAARRDFTMNAMYADPDGTIYDPTGGLEDLARGCVRFVGDPRARIEEDVLRLLRFFRFHARYGRGAPDKAALAACRAFAPQVKNLSGERVRAELFRLLETKDPARITALMARHGVMRHVVPGFTNHKRLAALAKREAEPDPLRRLAAGLSISARTVDALADRLRLSNVERARLSAMLGTPRPTPRMTPRERRRLLYRIGHEAYRDRALLAGYPRLAASRAKPPSLPVQGRDLVASGVKPGPEVGRLLAAVERWWMDRDFKPTRAQCLQHVQVLIRGHGTASRTIR